MIEIILKIVNTQFACIVVIFRQPTMPFRKNQDWLTKFILIPIDFYEEKMIEEMIQKDVFEVADLHEVDDSNSFQRMIL
jgi:hypothetical protein